jgi:hypothetical protein
MNPVPVCSISQKGIFPDFNIGGLFKEKQLLMKTAGPFLFE